VGERNAVCAAPVDETPAVHHPHRLVVGRGWDVVRDVGVGLQAKQHDSTIARNAHEDTPWVLLVRRDELEQALDWYLPTWRTREKRVKRVGEESE
jgi:hypothetical protein